MDKCFWKSGKNDIFLKIYTPEIFIKDFTQVVIRTYFTLLTNPFEVLIIAFVTSDSDVPTRERI